MPDVKVNPKAIVVAGPGIDSKDRSAWEYVTLPESDIFDKPHQGAAINQQRFFRGKTYFMPPDWAAELRRILEVMQKADIRILQSTPDRKAIREMSRDGHEFSENL